ncbi:hypothetical protein ACFL0H_00170 [Thermodesulfobacteriota bacterium]
MPVLHKYKSKKDYYILTSYNGKIITYQVSSDGIKRLFEAGAEPDKPFSRALLFDLKRSGDAYTHGQGPGEIDPDYQPLQIPLSFDIKNDPDPETMFPSCSKCSSLGDLHLVEIRGIGSQAIILCPKCRQEKAGLIDTSIPVYFISRGLLNRLLDRKKIDNIDESVHKYQELLDAEFESKWEALRKSKKNRTTQPRLFGKDSGGQEELF